MMYALAPFIGWLVAGCMKFAVNYIRFGSDAKERIGNGGFPSNHTTIMTTTVMLIGFGEGFISPVFGLGVAITFIVIIDALGLRRHVGNHAKAINKIVSSNPELSSQDKKFRESMGHTRIEVLGGIALGIILGFLLNQLV